jgi:TRAP-type C4-dicarboxylate transport system permease small subunit
MGRAGEVHRPDRLTRRSLADGDRATREALPASSFALTAARIERWLGRLVEVPVALLTALEVLILLAGVISRYVFHRPFTWSDELASILFLWLAMLGAVVAFRRGEHMRMSTLVARASPNWRVFFEAFAVAVAVAFLALVLYPTFEYALDEAAIVTPAMEIPNIWRASALPVGCALMLIFALLRLARAGGLGQILLALCLIALIGVGLWMLKPMFMAMGNYKLVVFFVVLVAAGVLAGAPIAFVFAIATFAFWRSPRARR